MTIYHQAPEGFTNLHSEIASNIPAAMKAFQRIANCPWRFLDDWSAKCVKKDLQQNGWYGSRTIGGREAFIKSFQADGKKRWLVVSMQSASEQIETPRQGKFVPVPDYDRAALVARLTA